MLTLYGTVKIYLENSLCPAIRLIASRLTLVTSETDEGVN